MQSLKGDTAVHTDYALMTMTNSRGNCYSSILTPLAPMADTQTQSSVLITVTSFMLAMV